MSVFKHAVCTVRREINHQSVKRLQHYASARMAEAYPQSVQAALFLAKVVQGFWEQIGRPAGHEIAANVLEDF